MLQLYPPMSCCYTDDSRAVGTSNQTLASKPSQQVVQAAIDVAACPLRLVHCRSAWVAVSKLCGLDSFQQYTQMHEHAGSPFSPYRQQRHQKP